MDSQLIDLGLSPSQASTYLYLLKKGQAVKPLTIAKAIDLTRSNTYKLLDSLIELHLVRRRQDGKTYAYEAEDPVALTDIASRMRNEAIRLEKKVKLTIPALRDVYEKTQKDAIVSVKRGRPTMYTALMKHAARAGELYFVRSRFDIHLMGYEHMKKVRHEPKLHGVKRYGITPDTAGSPNRPVIDARSGLTRTWVDDDAYTAQVEWSVHDNELLVVDYSGDGQLIRIESEVIADAFLQLWRMIDSSARRDPDYINLPRRAEREI